MKQQRLFGEDDLPLFSGTCPMGEVEVYVPEKITPAEQLELVNDDEEAAPVSQ